MPGGTTERAMIAAALVLIARELAVFAERSVVKVVAVAVEAIFGEIFVIFDLIFGAKFFGLSPGFCLDFKEFDVCMIICFAKEIVAELVEKEKLSFGVGIICFTSIKKRSGRGKLEALASLNL